MSDAQNPFSTSDHDVRSSLDPWERKLLRFFLENRDREVTVLELVGRLLKRWLVSVLIAGLMLTFLYAFVPELIDIVLVAFIFGLLVGATLGDVAAIRRTRALWPLYRRILDWTKIEQIVGGDDQKESNESK